MFFFLFIIHVLFVGIIYFFLYLSMFVFFFFIFFFFFFSSIFIFFFFFFSSRRRHTRCSRDWSSDVCSSDLQNPVYTNVHVDKRDDYGMSKTLVDSMLGWNDPRLPIYAQPNDTTGAYQGLPNGLNDGAGPQLKFISRFGTFWRETPAAPLALLTYSEVLFLEAEAAERGWITGNATQLYADAIRASMEQYGIATTAIDAYLAQPRVVYATGAAGLTQIAYQKWVSLFLQGMEGWTEVRRTGVPALVPGPNAVLTKIPERLPYSDNEAVLNKANLDAAVAAQHFSSSTDLTTPLWFTGR